MKEVNDIIQKVKQSIFDRQERPAQNDVRPGESYTKSALKLYSSVLIAWTTAVVGMSYYIAPPDLFHSHRDTACQSVSTPAQRATQPPELK